MPAPLSTYGQLVERIKATLGRSDIDAECADFIYLAQLQLQDDLQIRGAELTLPGTFTAGSPVLALPDDFLEAKLFRQESSQPAALKAVSLDQLDSIRWAAGNDVPIAFAATDNSFLVAPTPQSALGYTLVYVAEIAALSEQVKTNAILKRAPHALLYGACAQACLWAEADASAWVALYQRAMDGVRRAEWRARTGGGPLTMRPDAWA